MIRVADSRLTAPRVVQSSKNLSANEHGQRVFALSISHTNSGPSAFNLPGEAQTLSVAQFPDLPTIHPDFSVLLRMSAR